LCFSKNDKKNPCYSAVFSKVEVKDQHYTFSVMMSCSAPVYSNRYFHDIIDRYHQVLLENNKINIKDTKENVVQENLKGQKLLIEEEIVRKEGTLNTEATVFLLSDTKSKFKYEMTTNSVKGTGNAANTKHFSDSMEIFKRDESNEMILKKHLVIKKPWIAPEIIFIREVKKGMEKDMTHDYKQYLKKMKEK
tara:strand:+ start:349 stop:924 length:576 start_codon:yes stop_codon:yes gene_type:complete